MKILTRALAGLTMLFAALVAGVIYAPGPIIAQSVGLFQQVGAGAVARSFVSRMRDTYSVYDFTSAQAAVDALATLDGGKLFFPCGPDISLGSGARGLDLRGTFNIRLVGAQSVNSGSNSCGAIRYTGTGTMIDASGTTGFEMSNLFLVGSSAAKCLAFDQHATLAVYAKVSRNVIYCNTAASAVGIQVSYLIIATFEENSVNAYMTVRGDAEIPGEVANVINFNGNTFHTGSTYHVVNPLGIWNFNGNTYEGAVSGTSIYTTPGMVGDCYVLNLRGEDFDDPNPSPTGSNARIYTKCLQVNLKDSVISATTGQTGVEAIAGSGQRLNSDGTYFNLAATAVDINTGNCGQVTNYRAPFASSVLTGTPNGCGIADQNYNFVAFGAGIQLGATGVLTGRILWKGATSGTPIMTAQAVAGSPTLTLPTTTGTLVSTASGLLAVNATTGEMTCTNCASTANALSQFAATTSAQLRGVLSDESGTGAAVFQGGDIGAATGTSLAVTGNLRSSGAAAGIGYNTGAGCSTTQITSRTTAVTCNGVSGAITLFNAAGTSAATVFSVGNTSVAQQDTISLSVRGASNFYNAYVTNVAANSFSITFQSASGTASDTPTINFNVIKGTAN